MGYIKQKNRKMNKIQKKSAPKSHISKIIGADFFRILNGV